MLMDMNPPNPAIIGAGKVLRIWIGGKMCRRKQRGHNFVRGKRRKIEGGSILEICF